MTTKTKNKKEKIDYEKIIYSLNIEDIQTVALDQKGRELTIKEIDSIIDDIAESIPWYDIIDSVISEKITD